MNEARDVPSEDIFVYVIASEYSVIKRGMHMPSIMIADRDPNERSGISWLLNSWQIPYDLVYQAGTMEDVFQVLEDHVPDVICIELDMVARSNWERLKLLVEQFRPIVLGMTAEATFEKAMLAIELRARDLWLKPQTPEAIRRVLTRCSQEIVVACNRGRDVRVTGNSSEGEAVSYRELFVPNPLNHKEQILLLAQLEETRHHPALLAFLQEFPFRQIPVLLPLTDVIVGVFDTQQGKESLASMQQLARRILIEWEARHDSPLFLVVYEAQDQQKSLSEKYQDASQALQIRFFTGYRQVSVAEHVINWKTIDPFLTPAEQRAWVDMLHEGDEEGLKQWMYTQFSYQKGPYPEPGLLRIRLTSILAQVRRYMKSHGLDSANVEEDYHRVFEIILYSPILYRIIQELLLFIYKLMDVVQRQRGAAGIDVIELALRFMEGRYTDPTLRLEDVAGYVDRSPAYFSTLVSSSLGITFRQLLTNMRLKEAEQLIAETSLSIHEVAERSGFANANYFSKVFKEKLGTTPRIYRNQKKRVESNKITHR